LPLEQSGRETAVHAARIASETLKVPSLLHSPALSGGSSPRAFILWLVELELSLFREVMLGYKSHQKNTDESTASEITATSCANNDAGILERTDDENNETDGDDDTSGRDSKSAIEALLSAPVSPESLFTETYNATTTAIAPTTEATAETQVENAEARPENDDDQDEEQECEGDDMESWYLREFKSELDSGGEGTAHGKAAIEDSTLVPPTKALFSSSEVVPSAKKTVAEYPARIFASKEAERTRRFFLDRFSPQPILSYIPDNNALHESLKVLSQREHEQAVNLAEANTGRGAPIASCRGRRKAKCT